MRRAIYPGSFDPLHNGHLDVIERASRLCDEVVVAVAENISKNVTFSASARVKIIEEATAHLPGVCVTAFEGLLVEFARHSEADAIIRGLRAVSDFEYEFQMALMNRELDKEVETLFLMPAQEHIYLSSKIVKEIHQHGGDVAPFLPKASQRALLGSLPA